ncbi:MAG: hypothetical protein AB1641_24985 [Thermodesulfobacteriota bacterium]
MSFIVMTFLAGVIPAWAAQPPPIEYIRNIEIHVTDLSGNPLAGVRAQVTSAWGLILTESSLESDRRGVISLKVKPVIEQPEAGAHVRDRLLLYRLKVAYRLSKSGCLDKTGEIKDEQEFASFGDPLYDGLDRSPSPEPLIVQETVVSGRDFVAGPVKDENLVRLVETILADALDFTLKPGSLAVTSTGVLKIGLIYNLLFDPYELGLKAAASALMTHAVRDCLVIINRDMDRRVRPRGYEFSAEARFQDPDSPFSLPAPQDFIFKFTDEAARRIMAWSEDQPFPAAGIEAEAEGRPLDLSEAFLPAGRAN